MSNRVIALGNRSACIYRAHPRPPAALPLDRLEIWATHVCDLDLATVPAVGEFIKTTDGQNDYRVTESHRAALIRTLIERPVLASVLTGQKLCTTIVIGRDSDVDQAIAEAQRCWKGDGGMGMAMGQDAPAWIAWTVRPDPEHSEADIARQRNEVEEIGRSLARRLGIPEIREWEA